MLDDAEEVNDALGVEVVLLVTTLDEEVLDLPGELVNTSAPTTIITITTTAAPMTALETPRLVRMCA